MATPTDTQLQDELNKRLRDPGRTTVPNDWRPGFFASLFGGSRPPWGSLDEAWELLSERQIEPGRELLRRICQADPQKFEAQLLLAFDYMRPTENRAAGGPYLEAAKRQRPRSPEIQALWTIIGLLGMNGELMDESFTKMVGSQEPIESRHGAFLSLMAIVAASDLWLQHYRPKPRSIDRLWVIAPVKATAQLILRQHVDALKTFTDGNNRSNQFVATYEKNWNCRLSAQDAEQLTYDYAMFCRLGQGLVLYDAGVNFAGRQIVKDATGLSEWSGPVADFVRAAVKRL